MTDDEQKMELSRKEADEHRLDTLLRHITTVQEYVKLLAERMIDEKENHEFAKILIANSMQHDQSKFYGIE
jgi:hypothetical protein